MKRNQLLPVFFMLFFLFVSIVSFAGDSKPPDPVKTGIYITSIHNIDFKQKEYTIDLWRWLKYKNKEFYFLQNLEIPQAKTVIKSFSTVDSSDGKEIPVDETAVPDERFMEDCQLSFRSPEPAFLH